MQHRFYKVWLALGLLQIVAVSGCSENASSDTLLSSTPSEAAAQESSGEDMPVRLSRAFFEKSLAGTVQVQPADGSSAREVSSDVLWDEKIPQAALREDEIAADHQGCAIYKNANGVSLCFNIMSDVTSVGLNGDDAKITGLDAISDCGAPVKNARFVQASNQNGQVTVSFTADQAASARCAGGPVLITLNLRQI